MEFNKNALINQTISEYAQTWSCTLDTADFINEKYLKKIDKYIYNNLKKKFKEIEVYNLLFLQEKGYKLSIFDKLKINFSGLKPLYLWEKKEFQKQEKAKKQNRRRKIAK